MECVDDVIANAVTRVRMPTRTRTIPEPPIEELTKNLILSAKSPRRSNVIKLGLQHYNNKPCFIFSILLNDCQCGVNSRFHFVGIELFSQSVKHSLIYSHSGKTWLLIALGVLSTIVLTQQREVQTQLQRL